jgi:DGQHR domain-containing protein
MKNSICVPAIRVQQGTGREVFCFAVDGKLLTKFAAVSRLRSGGLDSLEGYQRPEVLGHIAEIQRYLESPKPILPNAIVLALNSSVRFETAGRTTESSDSTPGFLTIEWDAKAEAKDRPAWVVDGQQRLAAIRDARVSQFNVCVTAFITDSDDLQREQFLLLNNTRPLPKSLIYELLPGTPGNLPQALAKKRLPASLTRQLNEAEDSPFRGRIKLATNPGGVVRDNSVMRMLEHSLSDGALLRIRVGPGNDDEKEEAMLNQVTAFWSAVRDTWPDVWRLPPRRSRLLHGAGIVSLGFVMDEMVEYHRADHKLDSKRAVRELKLISDRCAWSGGSWPFGKGRERPWNEVQNTPSDVALLSNFLLREYRQRVRSQSAASAAT